VGIIVSDFDGTFYTGEKDIKINCEIIEKYIIDGNYFLLSSGRPYDSLMRQVEKYEIPHTHLATSDGTFLFNSSGNLLYSSEMEKGILDEISSILELANFERIEYSYPKYNSDFYDFRKKLGGIAFVIKEKNINDELRKRFENLKLNYSNYRFDIYGYDGIFYFVIRNPKVSKSVPIEYLATDLGINKRKIFTIGDNDNDFEMIRDYNGFMIGDNKALEEVALKKYNAVYELILDVRRKKVLKR
jgi:HAD superfamily hydrolase (TIGR01484 family)